QIRGQPGVVHDTKTCRHELAAQTLTLHRRVHSEPWQIPMRVPGVCRIHLVQYRKCVSVLRRRHGLHQNPDDLLTVELGVRRKPEGHSSAVAEPPGASQPECQSAEGGDKHWKMLAVLLVSRIKPT